MSRFSDSYYSASSTSTSKPDITHCVYDDDIISGASILDGNDEHVPGFVRSEDDDESATWFDARDIESGLFIVGSLSMEGLPVEILAEILSWLPFSEVLQCQRVSRQFRSVIVGMLNALPEVVKALIKAEKEVLSCISSMLSYEEVDFRVDSRCTPKVSPYFYEIFFTGVVSGVGWFIGSLFSSVFSTHASEASSDPEFGTSLESIFFATFMGMCRLFCTLSVASGPARLEPNS